MAIAMKIQRSFNKQPVACRKSIHHYCISILLGAMFAASVFVIKDFFFYHIHSDTGEELKASINEVFCAPTIGLENMFSRKIFQEPAFWFTRQ